MKINLLVGTALIASLFVFGSIYLFGLVSITVFPYAYFLLILLTFVLIINSMRYTIDSSDKIVAFVLAILIAVSGTYYATTMKGFIDLTPAIQDENENIESDINYITQTNEAYLSYVSNLKVQSDEIAKDSARLSGDILTLTDEINAQIEAKRQQQILLEAELAAQPIPEPEPIEEFYYYYEEFDENLEYDDSGYEGDDDD